MTTRTLAIFILIVLFSYSFGQTRKDSLYVFVGEKIEISDYQPQRYDSVIFLDYGVKAKFKVIQNIYGNYKRDTIEFEAYFHCGGGLFSRFKNVLLFVSAYDGKLYLEKYQYFDVYKTIDGSWASPGELSKFDSQYTGDIKSHHIQFVDTVSYDIRQPFNGCLKKKIFQEPYYRLEGDKAIAVMGVYVDEIFGIRKAGILKKNGFFE